VRDFRNLERIELEPPAEGFVVVGDNGQGKTNLLEAIYYLELLRSVRAARDQDLVRFGAPGFHIAARMETDRAREIAVGFERTGKRKRVRLDGVICERLSEAVGALPAVLFSPADVELVASGPATRRRFLDILLAVTSRGYLHALQRYRAALAHRNAALRELARRGRSGSEEAIAVWEPVLAEQGAAIWSERRAWEASVTDRFAELCGEIGEPGAVAMRYASAITSEDAERPREALARELAKQRGADLKFGVTRVGPHRDDLFLTLDGRELRVFGSGGQQRTAAIALRLLEAETLRERRGGPPVFLLDDPFAELDARRAGRIVQLLASAGFGQTVMAVPRAEAGDIPSGMPSLDRFTMTSGALRRAGTRV
jgi:DNA replication and repair protein RecF